MAGPAGILSHLLTTAIVTARISPPAHDRAAESPAQDRAAESPAPITTPPAAPDAPAALSDEMAARAARALADQILMRAEVLERTAQNLVQRSGAIPEAKSFREQALSLSSQLRQHCKALRDAGSPAEVRAAVQSVQSAIDKAEAELYRISVALDNAAQAARQQAQAIASDINLSQDEDDQVLNRGPEQPPTGQVGRVRAKVDTKNDNVYSKTMILATGAIANIFQKKESKRSDPCWPPGCVRRIS